MLKYQVKSIDKLPKEVADLYEKGEDGYTLKVEGVPKPEDNSGLKSALQKERERANNAEKELKAAATKAKDDSDAAARAAGDIETVEKNLHDHYKGEIEKRDALISKQGNKINSVLRRDGALSLATKFAVDGESAELLAEWIENRLEIAEDGDDYKLQPKGEFAGLSVEQFESKLPTQKSLARLIKASDGKGGGAANPASGGTAKPTNPNLGGSREERQAAIAERIAADQQTE